MAINYNIATTTEQSQRLASCGVNLATADMVWTKWEDDDEEIVKLSVLDEYAYEASCLNPIEAWSLSALIALIPKTITKGKIIYHLDISPDGGRWCIGYFSTEGIRTIKMLVKADDLVEACVEMIVLLLEYGYQ